MAVETYSHVMHIVSSVSGHAARRTSRRWTRCARRCRRARSRARRRSARCRSSTSSSRSSAAPTAARSATSRYTGDLDTCIHIRTRRGQGRARRTCRPAAASSPTRTRPTSSERPRRRRARCCDAIELACDAGGLGMTSVLVVDNYDSFTYNLVQYLGELGARARGGAQRRATSTSCSSASPTASSSRPGPCTPGRGGRLDRGHRAASPRRACRCSASASATRRWRRRSAARVVRGEPVHGKTAEIEHDGRTIFARPRIAARGRALPLARRRPGAAGRARGVRPRRAAW